MSLKLLRNLVQKSLERERQLVGLKGKAYRFRCSNCGHEFTFIPLRPYFARRIQCYFCGATLFISNWQCFGCELIRKL